MSINQNSTYFKQINSGHKRDGRMTGMKKYVTVKHCGSFYDVFKGVAENNAQITCVCDVPLKAPIYSISLSLVPKNGINSSRMEALQTLEADITADSVLGALVTVLPRSNNSLSPPSAKSLRNYFVSQKDNFAYNLYGNKLSIDNFYPIGLFKQNVPTQNPIQFNRTINLFSIDSCIYGSLVSCRQGAYNVFKRQDGANVINENELIDNTNRFSIASIFEESPENHDRAMAFASGGVGTIAICTVFFRNDNNELQSSAHFEAVFGDSFSPLDVIATVEYGEPFDDDMTALSTSHFIK